ncbi:aldo/keto reductase [Curtobacterium sp. MCBA15_013]|jgi:aryl-alcohol dehydrogenase-like predicted oxidoreductase|uniref:aldo/keto reductase n=1 Tax=Curtobacterium sp. MCBA15_013 TaxID=1898739 RepID=UPI0008DE12E5|nr:aldo/keto reductase [Curtobacterium sp. MCBA15_013]OII18855.1 oxidoreductase [Curtobacterium sp. MCBA15_013]
MTTTTDLHGVSAAAAGTFLIGGDLPVARLGFGSMQLAGRNAFGPSRDPEGARAVLRRAVELGVTLVDTADAYGPEVAEGLIGEALAPYRSDVVIATKGGFVRGPRGEWVVDGRPEHLRAAVQGSLRRLRLERIDLYQLHRIDQRVPLDEQLGTLAALRAEGLIRHVGLSEVSVPELLAAQRILPIATVQNLYNLVERSSEDLVRVTAELGIGFIPWFPLATGGLTRGAGALGAMAARAGASPSQVALAWLLQHAPNVLPIPGTSSVDHLEENVAAASVVLSPRDVAVLDGAA